MKKSSVLFAILLLFSAGCQNKETQAALDEMEANAELIQQNQDLIEQYIQSWNNQDFQVLDGCLDAEFMLYIPSGTGEPMALEKSKEWMDNLFTAFPDIHYEIQDMLADVDKVCVRWTCTATYQPDPDDPTNRREIKGSAIEIFRVVNGKITEERAETDSQDWQEQLGQ